MKLTRESTGAQRPRESSCLGDRAECSGRELAGRMLRDREKSFGRPSMPSQRATAGKRSGRRASRSCLKGGRARRSRPIGEVAREPTDRLTWEARAAEGRCSGYCGRKLGSRELCRQACMEAGRRCSGGRSKGTCPGPTEIEEDDRGRESSLGRPPGKMELARSRRTPWSGDRRGRHRGRRSQESWETAGTGGDGARPGAWPGAKLGRKIGTAWSGGHGHRGRSLAGSGRARGSCWSAEFLGSFTGVRGAWLGRPSGGAGRAAMKAEEDGGRLCKRVLLHRGSCFLLREEARSFSLSLCAIPSLCWSQWLTRSGDRIINTRGRRRVESLTPALTVGRPPPLSPDLDDEGVSFRGV